MLTTHPDHLSSNPRTPMEKGETDSCQLSSDLLWQVLMCTHTQNKEINVIKLTKTTNKK